MCRGWDLRTSGPEGVCRGWDLSSRPLRGKRRSPAGLVQRSAGQRTARRRPNSRHDEGTSRRDGQAGPGAGARAQGDTEGRAQVERLDERRSQPGSGQHRAGRAPGVAAAPRARPTRGHGADTARPTRPAGGLQRPGEEPPRTDRGGAGERHKRGTIRPGRTDRARGEPRGDDRGLHRDARASRRHGWSAPQPPPAKPTRTARAERTASRAIAAGVTPGPRRRNEAAR